MLLKVYSIRDSKGEKYNQPFYQNTHGEAERNFSRICVDPESLISKYPDDFDLYYIGDWDDQKGVLISLDTPQHIVKAVQCMRSARKQARKLDA